MAPKDIIISCQGVHLEVRSSPLWGRRYQIIIILSCCHFIQSSFRHFIISSYYQGTLGYHHIMPGRSLGRHIFLFLYFWQISDHHQTAVLSFAFVFVFVFTSLGRQIYPFCAHHRYQIIIILLSCQWYLYLFCICIHFSLVFVFVFINISYHDNCICIHLEGRYSSFVIAYSGSSLDYRHKELCISWTAFPSRYLSIFFVEFDKYRIRSNSKPQQNLMKRADLSIRSTRWS